jgi:hypothetical protein
MPKCRQCFYDILVQSNFHLRHSGTSSYMSKSLNIYGHDRITFLFYKIQERVLNCNVELPFLWKYQFWPKVHLRRSGKYRSLWKKFNYFPFPPKIDPLDRFFWKSIISMLLLLLTNFHVYPSTNVGAILVTTYYDTNLTKSPSQKSDYPVRIRVRIDPSHPLVCRKRRLNGAVLRTRPEKPRSRATACVAQ